MLKIGVHGQVTTEEARSLAKKYLSGVVHGNDPANVKKENRKLIAPNAPEVYHIIPYIMIPIMNFLIV